MSATRIKVLAAALAAMALAGCVSEQTSIDYKPRMGVAQSADGFVFFSVDTREGYEYSIYYWDVRDNLYKPVTGCERIRGTGEEIQIKRPYNSNKPLPEFTLRHVKLN